MGKDTRGRTIGIGDFDAEFAAILTEFEKECEKQTIKAVNAGAKKTLNDLQQTTDPRLTGEYASGWKSKPERVLYGGYYVRIYNKHRYMLTHLLEFGHANAIGGGRTPAHPHMEAAYSSGAREMERRLNQ